MTRRELERRADALVAARVPFVSAIVVHVRHPSSVRPGDSAIVLGDGTIHGFVGGACAEASVRLQALSVIDTGEPVLLRIVPGAGEPAAEEGAVTVENPCLSGGALEIFLEPRLPAPRVIVLGDTPVALALQSVGERVGFDVMLTADGDIEPEADDVALVVASHGRAEEPALATALRTAVPYVGLVASRRRGAAVRDALLEAGVGEAELARLRTPAGLDIGARTPEEIALSILAEVVSVRRAKHAPAIESATDPVCGMTVAAAPPSPRVEHAGHAVWFCSEGCRDSFRAEPSRYSAAL